MKHTNLLAALLLLPLLMSAQRANDYTKYVNPFIGTQTDETGALSGSTFPGATMPQGMVQLGPETELMVTWDPCSGYDYNKDVIYGFTHTHLSGTGCTDLIDVSLMPLSRNVTSEQLAAADFGHHVHGHSSLYLPRRKTANHSPRPRPWHVPRRGLLLETTHLRDHPKPNSHRR